VSELYNNFVLLYVIIYLYTTLRTALHIGYSSTQRDNFYVFYIITFTLL